MRRKLFHEQDLLSRPLSECRSFYRTWSSWSKCSLISNHVVKANWWENGSTWLKRTIGPLSQYVNVRLLRKNFRFLDLVISVTSSSSFKDVMAKVWILSNTVRTQISLFFNAGERLSGWKVHQAWWCLQECDQRSGARLTLCQPQAQTQSSWVRGSWGLPQLLTPVFKYEVQLY
jgi:hypothetical protein